MKIFYTKMAAAAIALATSATVASATCISGCDPSANGGITIGGSAFFSGDVASIFDSPNGNGWVEQDKAGYSDISVNVTDGSFCPGDVCDGSTVSGWVDAGEHGWAKVGANGDTSAEPVKVESQGQFEAGSKLIIGVEDGHDTTLTSLGTAGFRNFGGGVAQGDQTHTDVFSYGIGGTDTAVEYAGSPCGIDCGDVGGGVHSYATGGMTVFSQALGDTSGQLLRLQNRGSTDAFAGSQTGFETMMPDNQP